MLQKAKNLVTTGTTKPLPKSLYGQTTPLTITGRFFNDPKLNTFVLDSIANDNATVNFNNGTLVPAGKENNADKEQSLLKLLSESPGIVSNGVIPEGDAPPTPVTADPNAATTAPAAPAAKSGMISKFFSSFSSSNPNPPVITQSPSSTAATAPGAGDAADAAATATATATNPAPLLTPNPDVHDKTDGGTRRVRRGKRKTHNKRNYRKSRRYRK